MNIMKTHQKGFSLIEIMIALVISLTLLGGLSEVYLGSKQSYTLVEETSRLQENGRFAIDILTREIRGAGFFGCLKDPNSAAVLNHINSTDPIYDFGETLTGVDGGGTNSDGISFSRASGKGINLTDQQTLASANVKIQTGHGIADGDIIILSDCSVGDVFQVTQAANAHLVHNTGSGTPGNASLPSVGACPGANAHCLSKKYDKDAQIFKIGRVGYNIQVGANGNNGLFRSDSAKPNGVEIIENVENMQILYGENDDNDRFNTPNKYMTATNIGSIDNAITVRIALLLKGSRIIQPANVNQNHQLLDASVNTNDRLLYKIFTTTITIRNRAVIDGA
ncbi:MAG: PilW family protein [Sulfuriflexus sp.]|nr:PilW family protein [Sulfuriflexus sp.]